MRAWQTSNPLKVQLWNIRRRARVLGLEFAITLPDLEAAWPADNCCKVCGVKLIRSGDDRGQSGSVDRIDSTKGYVPGNIHVVCLGCNGFKRDLTVEEMGDGEAGPEWQSWARNYLGLP